MELHINRYIQKNRSGGNFTLSIEGMSQKNFNRLSSIFVEMTERVNGFSCSSQMELFFDSVLEKILSPLPWDPVERKGDADS